MLAREIVGSDHTARPIRARARLITAVVCAVSLLGVSAAAAVVVDTILATIDGEPLTSYELKNFATGNPAAIKLGQENPDALLDALITSRLIRREIEMRGIVIGDTEIDNYVAQIRQQNKISEEQLYQALAEQGLSAEAYRAQIKEELERAQLINREIRGKVSITDEDIERDYNAHLAEYTTPPEVTVSHIMLRLDPKATDSEVRRAMEKANEIHAQLDRGKDFAELARQYSEDPAAESGGTLGTFHIGSMLDALNDTVAELDVGEYSDPVRSSVGIHIVRLDARSPTTYTPLEEVSDTIRQRLYGEALEKRYARWLTEDLRARHHVERID